MTTLQASAFIMVVAACRMKTNSSAKILQLRYCNDIAIYSIRRSIECVGDSLQKNDDKNT